LSTLNDNNYFEIEHFNLLLKRTQCLYGTGVLFHYNIQVGPNTRKAPAVLMVTLLMAISMAFSGCINIQNIVNPATTITPAVITITATPKPPTVTPAPTVVARQMSSDVKIMAVGDKGIVGFDSHPSGDKQYENFSIMVANDGTDEAKNVVMTLTETDAHGGNMLVQQTFTIGDIKKGERKVYEVITAEHDQAANILIVANLEWGVNGEYYNPMKFIDTTKSIIWMIKI
jgi:hypothetical protein